jgi:hypothetical protein
MPKPKVLNTEIPTGFRASSLEEAVRVLGGSVLLIDGMTPQMVLVGPGRRIRRRESRSGGGTSRLR